MSPDLTLLTPADSKLLATLTGPRRGKTLQRLAAVQQVANAPAGTKNAIMARLSDAMGITIGGITTHCACYRKGGLAAILPRNDAKVAAASRSRP